MATNTRSNTGAVMILTISIIALQSKNCLALLAPSSPSLQASRLQPPIKFARHQFHGAPSNTDPSSLANIASFTTKTRVHRKNFITSVFSSTSKSADDESNNRDVASPSSSTTQTPLFVAMVVGVATSLIGYIYSKMMKTGFRFFWKTLPAAIFDSTANGGSFCALRSFLIRHPQAYIVMLMTSGAFTVGMLSNYFGNLFSAHEYVHILSEKDNEGGEENKMDEFPKCRDVLLPVLVMSCLTSVTGFSLGPEAPMVCAGGLAGVSLARKYSQYLSNKSETLDKKTTQSLEETLAYAGAAGTLTGFMNVPLAGPIFAMEMTSRNAGIPPNAARSWSAAMAASLAGMVFVRGALMPAANLGGHFTYATKAGVGVINGVEMVFAGLGCGVLGALVGTCFHKVVHFLKSLFWPVSSSPQSSSKNNYMPILKKTLVGLAIGLLSTKFPQTMFWGEGSLQCVVDGQCTPFASTPHGIPSIMTQFAHVDPNIPFSAQSSPFASALQVGIAKFFAIALATSVKLPGGVIFPLLSNGASLAHALVSAVISVIPVASSSLLVPTMIMSFMAATLTSITRTPLATVLILAFSSSGLTSLSAILPGALLASYVSVWVSDCVSKESYFGYAD